MGERAIVYLDDVIAKVEYHVNRDVRAPLIEALEALPSPPAGGVSRAESATVRVADVLRAALDVLDDEDYARLAARIDAIPTSTPATPTDADLCALADEVAGLRETLTRIGIQRIAATGPDAEGLEAPRLVAMARMRELLGGVATTPPDPAVERANLRGLAEAATPGEWTRCGDDRGGCGCRLVFAEHAAVAQACSCTDADSMGEGYTEKQAKANAAFIAAANPRAVIRLLDKVDAAASRWLWTVAADRTSATLHFRTPGQSGFAPVASALPREDGMLAVRIAGQTHTAADDLLAALATIRAVLGGDVPDLPADRSDK